MCFGTVLGYDGKGMTDGQEEVKWMDGLRSMVYHSYLLWSDHSHFLFANCLQVKKDAHQMCPALGTGSVQGTWALVPEMHSSFWSLLLSQGASWQ